MGQIIWKTIQTVLFYGSGEFLLERRSNSGAVVFARALWTTIIVYSLALLLRECLPPDSTMHFSFSRFRLAFAETIPWFAAVFAGSYAVLYARFASQWTYLADLYNQIMAVQAQTEKTPESTHWLAMWEAGFIEDAEEMHLEKKPIYASVIRSMLDQSEVRDMYVKYTPGPRGTPKTGHTWSPQNRP
ncbi:MAG: hypothetical protein H0U60_11020 [Blastocatellia bacterium]|nr:hypothetical protein [Blastocatellia bacterium]